jgi:L,D-peptidoglycan transpeptidase YkuD (ErfK/YbiS/YcfS/YnhG family)
MAVTSRLIVTPHQLVFNGQSFTCALGKGGLSAFKREGDGATPLGIFTLRQCLYRPDRLGTPATRLPVKAIGENDGWCDDPKSPCYNLPVPLPFSYSHERLWRDDHVYDLIIPLGYNDDPVIPGKGSAIFMHVARKHYEPTEGCVALALPDLQVLLPHLDSSTCIEIRQS